MNTLSIFFCHSLLPGQNVRQLFIFSRMREQANQNKVKTRLLPALNSNFPRKIQHTAGWFVRQLTIRLLTQFRAEMLISCIHYSVSLHEVKLVCLQKKLHPVWSKRIDRFTFPLFQPLGMRRGLIISTGPSSGYFKCEKLMEPNESFNLRAGQVDKNAKRFMERERKKRRFL